MMTRLYFELKPGVVYRGDNRFFLDDLIGKDYVVAEEFLVTDCQADIVKLHLEGSQMARIERKNRPKEKVPRQPWLITSNFPLCTMCPRHNVAMNARLYTFCIVETEDIADICKLYYSLTDNEQIQLVYRVFNL